MRRSDQLDPAQARELEQLDRVLAGEAGPEAAELELLVRAVRADRPPLRPQFAAELDARAAAGFPRPARPGRRRRPAARHWLAGLGGAVALAVAIAVAAGTPGSSRQAAGTAADAGGARTPASTQKQMLLAPSGAASAAPPAAPLPAPSGAASAAPLAAPRTVERDAALSLLAPHGQVQQVADRAIAATDRLGGIVASSNVAVDDQGGSQADLELQVPAAALDRTLAALSALAHVSSRSQSTQDITDATAAARDRLAESRAERQALLRQLASARTPAAVQSIHARLGLLDGRIAADQRQLDTLVGHGRTAQLTVTIDEAAQSAGGSGLLPGSALDDARRVLEGAFGVLVIGLAGLVPAGLVAWAIWWALAVLRRRRRAAGLA